MPFEIEIPVRYGSIDYARLVYGPQFHHFCHVTKEAMFAEVVGVTYAELLANEQVGYPAAGVKADFHAPVSFGETLRIVMTVGRIGTSSVEFVYRGHRMSDDALAFEITNTEVAVDMEAWKSVPIPAHHRSAFEGLQA